MAKEFIIWGVAPGGESEALLVSEQAGIKSEAQAQTVIEKLETEHGCTKCRVQVFRLSDGFEWGANLFA